MTHHNEQNQLNEAVKRIAELDDSDAVWGFRLMHETVAQQAAIIEQQRSTMESMQRWINHHNERADKAEATIQQLQSELAEQCRIVGAGGERELALMAKVEQQRAVLVQARDRLYQARDFMPDGEVIFIDTAITAIDNVLGV